jgi:hypothetical protein
MHRLTNFCQAGQDLSDQRIASAIKLEDYLANTQKHELEVTLFFSIKGYMERLKGWLSPILLGDGPNTREMNEQCHIKARVLRAACQGPQSKKGPPSNVSVNILNIKTNYMETLY